LNYFFKPYICKTADGRSKHLINRVGNEVYGRI